MFEEFRTPILILIIIIVYVERSYTIKKKKILLKLIMSQIDYMD